MSVWTCYFLQAPFAWLIASVWHGMEEISLLCEWGFKKIPFMLTFRFPVLFRLQSIISSLLDKILLTFYKVQVRLISWASKHRDIEAIRDNTGTSGNVGRRWVQLENEISISKNLDKRKAKNKIIEFLSVIQHQQMIWLALAHVMNITVRAFPPKKNGR